MRRAQNAQTERWRGAGGGREEQGLTGGREHASEPDLAVFAQPGERTGNTPGGGHSGDVRGLRSRVTRPSGGENRNPARCPRRCCCGRNESGGPDTLFTLIRPAHLVNQGISALAITPVSVIP